MYFIPSIPYREEPYPPYWGTINSQTNFCEEVCKPSIFDDTSYTSIIYYAYKGIRANTNRQDAIIRNLPYLGLAGVGILSALFHSTNKYWTQWFDDTSMLIATSTVVHRVFTYDKSFKYTVIYGSSLFIFMVAFIAWHCITDETLIHPILFGIEIAFVGIKTRSIINLRVADKLVQKQVKKLVTYGGVIFITGFILWNIDNTFCASLTQTKRSIEAGQELGKNFAWPVGMISGGGKTHLIIDDRVGDIDGVMELGKGKGGRSDGLGLTLRDGFLDGAGGGNGNGKDAYELIHGRKKSE
ncbi:hypothetical protein SS1G_05065 [Sclerotinia sclerotiorum 1980 UF-70]|uniref:Uncharacterized protein n=1 Tax=Sclerotinia sclerotiorum (strain ATCC 18683 / 1980 / Ss-1) TaxID=665079 RepID=A7EIC2_SCLS1|nr:hypothetical protein SS1G_05065 [Sclerotinia sclerotiorum 1980 UF-70]EDO02588.1 hypothetical protein SS1G_05065 [Sclerotinia sclerotiorum 1980 UF-70]